MTDPYSTECDLVATLDEIGRQIGAIHDAELGRAALYAFGIRQRALGARMVIAVAQTAIDACKWAEPAPELVHDEH